MKIFGCCVSKPSDDQIVGRAHREAKKNEIPKTKAEFDRRIAAAVILDKQIEASQSKIVKAQGRIALAEKQIEENNASSARIARAMEQALASRQARKAQEAENLASK